MTGASTLASCALALAIASLFGPLLGRLATQWFSGRGLSNLLTEVRGSFLPFLLAAILSEKTTWNIWVVIGMVVGFTQAIAVGRWIARGDGRRSRSLLGGIALGRSQAALLSAQATASGAVVGTLALTILQVVLVEALLSALDVALVSPGGSVGAAIFAGSRTEIVFFVVLGASAILGTEALTSWLFQRRAGHKAR